MRLQLDLTFHLEQVIQFFVYERGMFLFKVDTFFKEQKTSPYFIHSNVSF